MYLKNNRKSGFQFSLIRIEGDWYQKSIKYKKIFSLNFKIRFMPMFSVCTYKWKRKKYPYIYFVYYIKRSQNRSTSIRNKKGIRITH